MNAPTHVLVLVALAGAIFAIGGVVVMDNMIKKDRFIVAAIGAVTAIIGGLAVYVVIRIVAA